MITVYFDIETSYDTVWKEGLLIKLQKMGIQGRMFNWIQQFFTERSFKVKVGNEVSESYKGVEYRKEV